VELELLEGGLGGALEPGATGADGALVRVVEGVGVGRAGRPIELNGAEVEGHAGDSYEEMMRLRQTTSIPGQNP
jgi:hypothetical protein